MSCFNPFNFQCVVTSLLWKAGARVGCSISASSKCKLPWWKQLFGVVSEADYAERERCEEGEMSACLAASKESCVQFAKDKCLPPFRDARIAFNWKLNGAPQLIFSAPDTAAADALDSNILECASGGGGGVAPTNYRGSILLEKKSSI
ncbi:uncharacterized protein M6B38_180655 [Iris pallida]|uniref:Uncharacterized protein n=1 Tax=Iris pallida TaxID=29817 RepID=A0AAX6EMT3_IRIPA|nr:uncharacterized protein M6B38_180655 [Iris pallida]